jgi:hypothetical protein
MTANGDEKRARELANRNGSPLERFRQKELRFLVMAAGKLAQWGDANCICPSRCNRRGVALSGLIVPSPLLAVTICNASTAESVNFLEGCTLGGL